MDEKDMVAVNIGTEDSKKKFYIPRATYAKSKVFPLWATQQSSIKTSYTNAQIATMMKNPEVNYSNLQKVSNYLFGLSSSYQNIAYYLATMITFDWMVIPNEMTDNPITMLNRLESASKKVHESNPKSIFPMMVLRTIVNGETYWYDLSDGNNTIYKEIPSKYCRLAMIDDDNLWRYYVDLSLIKDDDLYELPTEIQIAHKRWIDDGKSKSKKSKIIDGLEVQMYDYLYLVSKSGFCMHIHMTNSQHDYPLLASMFMDWNNLETDKDYVREILKDENVKLIHLKIPTDNEGIPLIDKDTVEVYHESAKEHLPSNVAPLTNPFEVTGLNVDSAQRTQINLLEHDQKVVNVDSGISETMFNASTVNSIGYSVKSDVTKIFPILYYFNNLMNYKLKKEKFICNFLQITHYDREDKHKQYSSDLAVGGSRFLFMSTSELDLYEYIKTLKLESMLNIDELLIPKANANQMAVTSSQSGGRPNIDDENKADSTIIGDTYK